MTIEFNHTLVHARDPRVSAEFMAEILGLPEPTTYGPFHVVTTHNDVNVDFMQTDRDFETQHYAFLVSEEEFDAIFGRICDREMDHWADPRQERPGEINHRDQGRGVYFKDPDGHMLEILTRPYAAETG